MNALQIVIWTIYAAVIATGVGILIWLAKCAIKSAAVRWRDPLPSFDYGERHSDWEGE